MISGENEVIFDYVHWLERLKLPSNPQVVERLRLLAQELRTLNMQVNLVSRKDIHLLEVHHILHVLLGAHYLEWSVGARILDVGTGGGLPGLVLAILFPDCTFTLLDSVRKKILAVERIAAKLELTHLRCIWSRVEQHTAQYDYITGRAVTALPVFWGWVNGHLDPRSEREPAPGVWYWKGGDLSQELADLPTEVRVQVFDLGCLVPEIPHYETKSLLYLTVQ
jgi:16S rRNA (guanine527-N7)-methyltransferase